MSADTCEEKTSVFSEYVNKWGPKKVRGRVSGREGGPAQNDEDQDQSHALSVYTAIPSSESQKKPQMLSMIGTQALA